MRLDGQVAIVTGSARGIGEGYATGVAEAGARVVVADRNVELGEAVAAKIRAGGGDAVFVEVDVADAASVTRMAATAIETFGGIDLLVNNAAIFHSMDTTPLISMDWDYYLDFMGVNLHGALLCTRACYPSMVERGGGAIVNQSSTAAWMGTGAYSVAKLGINGLTSALARELGPLGIRVNALAPGPIDTEAFHTVIDPDPAYRAMLDGMVASMPIPRMGTPADLVGALVFLLSEDARWVTGVVFNVDGGNYLRV